MPTFRTTDRVTKRDLLRAGGSALVLCGLPGAGFAAPETSGKEGAGKDGSGKINVAFVGDSMIDGVWGGALRLAAADRCLSQHYKFGRFGENGTGLTRPGKYDWILVTKGIIAEFKPALIVVSLGLNDRQNIVDLDGTRYGLGTDGWRTRYGQLVAELAQAGKDVPAGLLWLGLPVLRDKAAQADALEKNTLVAKALADMKDPKVRYLEPWHPEGDNSFQPYGHGLDGSLVQLRATDGIHFTSMGYDVIARYLLPTMMGQLRDHHVTPDTPCEAVR